MGESELYERVEPDDTLSGDEKETCISMYGTDKSFRVHTSKSTVVKSLLRHDHFDPERIRGEDVRGNICCAESREGAREELSIIYSCTGKMPVGCLSVKSKPRTRDVQSTIVTHEKVSSDVWSDDDT